MTEPEMEPEMEPEAESETRAQITGLIAAGVGDPAVLVMLRGMQEVLLKLDDLEAEVDDLKERVKHFDRMLYVNDLVVADLMKRRMGEGPRIWKKWEEQW
jgi:hypothetical protein